MAHAPTNWAPLCGVPQLRGVRPPSLQRWNFKIIKTLKNFKNFNFLNVKNLKRFHKFKIFRIKLFQNLMIFTIRENFKLFNAP